MNNSYLKEAEAYPRGAENEVRNEVKQEFPIGASVKVKAGQGHFLGVIQAHAGPSQHCRQVSVLRTSPEAMTGYISAHRPKPRWFNYLNLEIVP